MFDASLPVASTWVRVLPDVSGIDRPFDYLVPERFGTLEVGTIVRVPLGPRRARGWVVESLASLPELDTALREIHSVVSAGPTAETLELAEASARRYVGRLRPLLIAASPPRNVAVGEVAPFEAVRSRPESPGGVELRRLAPCASRLSVVEEVLGAEPVGQVLVLVPNGHDADRLEQLLARRGHDVARYPAEWQRARSGAPVVIGMRSAAFCPLRALRAIVVLDAHAEAFVEERAPTYSAVVVAELRAEMAGVRLVLTSPCPSLELLARHEEMRPPEALEAADWPAVEVIDRRDEDPRAGLYGEGLSMTLRHALEHDPDRPVVAVLNRKGRIRRLACTRCKELVVCEHCGAALSELARQSDAEAIELGCASCGARRPKVCASCGSTRLKALRVGVQRVAEELEALVHEPVHLVEGDGPVSSEARLIVGTEAVLHRLGRASLVVFLDFDQELLAPRFRAGEEALALLALAGRLTGPRRNGAERRVVIQTRLADHEVLAAARRGRPDELLAPERRRRDELGLPPARALALVSGERLGAFLEPLAARRDLALEVARLSEDRALVRGPTSEAVSDALCSIGLPASGVRVEVDPLRI